ncbi:MAG: LacI family DNA-binding transcriptional regulator [Clostridia bacterium]|nr:LacI family DNA-binding transcriptional regulator [Clostridia bacterium]
MKDVARESGLSLATVSKVINGLPVGKESRRLVEEAIDKLGYHVNAYARALKSSKTNTVALVLPSLKHPFFAHMADELTASLTSVGYRSLLMITNYDRQAEQTCFSMVRNNLVDGIIALTYNPHLKVDESVPIVSIDRHLGENIPCVSSDNYYGGELAAKKLLELGCRKLLFIRISSHTPGEPNKRFSGFENVCQAQGVEYEAILLHDDESTEPIFRFLEEHVVGEHPEFDGIFCNADSLAGKVLRFLQQHGVDVPGQVQIIGYDGVPDFFADQYVCSTIEQPLSQITQTAVRLLLNPDESSIGLNVCLPVKYIPGSTTKD